MDLSMTSFVNTSHQLEEKCKTIVNNEKRDQLIVTYLSERHAEYVNGTRPSFDFPANLEWLNCENQLSFENELNGKLCVLDIFTYCCINCMHVMPDLKHLHSKFSIEDGVMIIGVHSAKFDDEKSTANVIHSILRHELDHPVVNDERGIIYDSLDIQCWPTFVILGPQGQFLHVLHGEGKREMLMWLVRLGLRYYDSLGLLSHHSIPLSLERHKIKPMTLSFPGKVCVVNDGDDIVISDSGHHRILIVGKDGITRSCVGNKEYFEEGFVDGIFQKARFNNPQGITCSRDGKTIFVADTNNHAIRKIDLEYCEVTTIAGTGNQGNDLVGGGEGKMQALNSPWDLTLGPSPGCEDQEVVLYIAMAGSHQIWALALEDCVWFNNRSLRRGCCLAFCGSGDEENRNNYYPHKAGFAQPSGIVSTNSSLYVADSESSTIRMIDIKTGSVKGLVGGGLDPKDLFSFGDVDGIGMSAKLQHPIGIAWRACSKDVIIADSYNHKIKIINPTKRTSTTLIDGNCGPGMNDKIVPDVKLREPSGLHLSPDGNSLYIANTNAHVITMINLQTMEQLTMNIIFTEAVSDSVDNVNDKVLVTDAKPVIRLNQVCLPMDAYGDIQISVTLPKQSHFTPGAKHKWIYVKDTAATTIISLDKFRGKFEQSLEILTTYQLNSPRAVDAFVVKFDVTVYYCDDLTGTCRIADSRLVLPIAVTEKEEAVSSHSIALDFIVQ